MKRPATAGAVLLAVLLAFPSLASAQAMRTITGHVTAQGASGPPSGVQIVVQGTNLGTLTDAKGNFTIQAPAGATTLVLTYIGYRTTNVPIKGHVEVTLKQEAIGLQGLVVTALGIQREKKTLGYSVEDVSGAQVNAVPQTNIVNTLQGQVAGVHITNAGVTGGSTRIVIRGASSLLGNNQPLFIVDGVPVDNTSPTGMLNYWGVDWGNALQDLDPNNIQSISVLKGPNAAALYGTRAANGAIVITTKSAQPGSDYGVSATSSLTFQTPLKLPQYQNKYGQGYYGQFQWVDGFGNGTFDGTDESWGPALNGQLIDQFTGKQKPFLPHPNNVRDYFKTGSNWEVSAAVARATTSNNIRLSVTHNNILSMAPGYSIGRNDVQLKGGSTISSKVQVKGEVTYMVQDAHNRMGTGYDDDNIMQSFTWFGRQVDLNALRAYRCNASDPTPCVPGLEYNWNYNYHDNPYWVQFVNTSYDQRKRVVGDVGVYYQATDWLTLIGKATTDWYRWNQDDNTEVGTVFGETGTHGGFINENIYRNETNYYLTAAATRQLTPTILMNVHVGAQTRKDDYLDNHVDVTRLTVPGIFNLSNSAVVPVTTGYESHKEVRSLYGDLTLNYKGWWNVDVTGRNDWSSTLPVRHMSFFYPSVSSALVFTDALGMNSRLLSSGKIRASWTRVGNDTDPYQLAATLTAFQPMGGQAVFVVPMKLANANLKPEQTTAWSVGTDLGFFDERMGFVLTYYDNTTRDEILPVDISGASGFTNRILNAGEVENKGWELQLNATPLRLDNGFRWDVTVNWAKNFNRVRKLYGDLQRLVIGTNWVPVVAIPGKPYGEILGYTPLRDANGNLLLTPNGLLRPNPVLHNYGTYAPDWTGGIGNRFSYGPWDLSVLFDGQKGGTIYSITEAFGTSTGVLARTMRGRENSPTDPGIVIKGILPDGVMNGTTETQKVTAMDYFHNATYTAGLYSFDDASYLKLRMVRLAYRLPTSLMHRMGFSSGDVALVGHNLLLFAHARNIDPETALDASNRQGMESGQFPTARSYGFSISIRP